LGKQPGLAEAGRFYRSYLSLKIEDFPLSLWFLLGELLFSTKIEIAQVK
jgi:hypothetical protein